MAGIADIRAGRRRRPLRATGDVAWVRRVVIGLSLAYVCAFLVLPLGVVFQEALRKGFDPWAAAFRDPATGHAIQLTLLVAAVAVPLNTLLGLAAAWAVTRFRFRGKGLLVSLIELPLWVSPVIGGLIYVLLFGAQGWFGPSLQEHGIKIIFALPGIILATIFVTFPFVARTVIPQMRAQGYAEEEAAMTLGAGGLRTFFSVTLPKIKWSLIYGVILCNARSMGEFGAVSVVSGHIRNQTNTVPLQIEILYNEYQFVPAFALASVLCLLALLTLGLKSFIEWRHDRELRAAQHPHDP